MLSDHNSDIAERCEAARAAFELGWAEGLATVTAKRALIRVAWGNGTRTMRMLKGGQSGSERGRDMEEGFSGLEDVKSLDDFSITDERCPRLCFAGPRRDGSHADDCPHKAGWDAFEDEL